MYTLVRVTRDTKLEGIHGVTRISRPSYKLPQQRIMTNDTVSMTEPSARAIELSFPMPKAPETRIHLKLTINTTSLLLFLTTAMNGDTSATAPLGSFVYALPDVRYLIHAATIYTKLTVL